MKKLLKTGFGGNIHMNAWPAQEPNIAEKSYWKSRFNYWIKIVSIIVIGTFLYQQMALAYGGPTSPQSRPAGSSVNDFRLDSFKLPKEIGTQRGIFSSDSDETIIHIQDAHASISAQESIVKLLDNLLTNYDMNVVAVEGSSGYIDTSFLRTFPIDDLKRKAAKHFMEEGKLSAGEFFSICSEEPVALYGVENEDFYEDNLESFAKLWSDRKEVLRSVKSLEKALKRLDKKVYTDQIIKLNETIN